MWKRRVSGTRNEVELRDRENEVNFIALVLKTRWRATRRHIFRSSEVT